MARFEKDHKIRSTLNPRKAQGGRKIEAYFVPAQRPESGSPASQRLAESIKLLDLELESGILKIYPINTLEHASSYLCPKYKRIRTLTLESTFLSDDYVETDIEAVLEELPPGFVRDFTYGLGLRRDCNRFIRLIEENTSCDEIVFSTKDEARVEDSKFVIGLSRFSSIWTELQRISSRGSRATGRVKDVFVSNSLSETLHLSRREVSFGRLPDSQIITKAAAGLSELNESEQNQLIGAVTSESPALARNQPEKFIRLYRDIELVNLDRLILSFELSLNEDKNERYWQTFFENNAFALQQVFGTAMVHVQSEVTVGGQALTGSGAKIADYMYKNALTNNIALVEIKKPTMQLLDSRGYRGGVFGASRDLNGAVTQVLDQAHTFAQNFATLKMNSRQYDLESYAIACFVIAGRTPTADEYERQKSFELFRANSRNVTVVTYDEILEKLKALRHLLGSQNSENKRQR